MPIEPKQFLAESDPILANIITQIPEYIIESTDDIFHDLKIKCYFVMKSSHKHSNKFTTFNKIFHETNEMGIDFCLRCLN